MPLNMDQIQALKAGSRTKGLYLQYLVQFSNSGEAGVCAQEEWPADFGEKTDTTVKQGFENAKNSKNAPEGSENIQVVNNEGKTYLLNNNVLNEATAASASAE